MTQEERRICEKSPNCFKCQFYDTSTFECIFLTQGKNHMREVDKFIEKASSIEELMDGRMKNFYRYDYEMAYQYMIDNFKRYGIEKVEGTVQFLKEGEPYDIIDDIKLSIKLRLNVLNKMNQVFAAEI